MKILMHFFSTLILVTFCSSCTYDEYTSGVIFEDTPYEVNTSYTTCYANINLPVIEASRVRIKLQSCDIHTNFTYELDATASKYFNLDPELFMLTGKENLISKGIESIENFGQINIYNRDLLIENRIISVRAIDIPVEPHEDIVACYPLDGDGTDLTVYANHAETKNTTAVTGINQDKYGALKLNGEEAIISAPHQNHLNLKKEFTLSAWVKLDERKTQSIVRKGTIINGPHSVPFALGLSKTGDLVFAMHNNEDVRFEARKSEYPLCEWIHLAASYNNGEMKLYENGLLVKTADGPIEANTNNSPLIMGTRLKLESDTMNGSIDDVRIYRKALTASEVKKLSLQNLK